MIIQSAEYLFDFVNHVVDEVSTQGTPPLQGDYRPDRYSTQAGLAILFLIRRLGYKA
jgi:hypothetical protein